MFACMGIHMCLAIIEDPGFRCARPGDALAEPYGPTFEAFRGELVGAVRSSPDGRVRHDLEHVVRSCRDLSLLDTGTRLLLDRRP